MIYKSYSADSIQQHNKSLKLAVFVKQISENCLYLMTQRLSMHLCRKEIIGLGTKLIFRNSINTNYIRKKNSRTVQDLVGANGSVEYIQYTSRL